MPRPPKPKKDFWDKAGVISTFAQGVLIAGILGMRDAGLHRPPERGAEPGQGGGAEGHQGQGDRLIPALLDGQGSHVGHGIGREGFGAVAGRQGHGPDGDQDPGGCRLRPRNRPRWPRARGTCGRPTGILNSVTGDERGLLTPQDRRDAGSDSPSKRSGTAGPPSRAATVAPRAVDHLTRVDTLKLVEWIPDVQTLSVDVWGHPRSRSVRPRQAHPTEVSQD